MFEQFRKSKKAYQKAINKAKENQRKADEREFSRKVSLQIQTLEEKHMYEIMEKNAEIGQLRALIKNMEETVTNAEKKQHDAIAQARKNAAIAGQINFFTEHFTKTVAGTLSTIKKIQDTADEYVTELNKKDKKERPRLVVVEDNSKIVEASRPGTDKAQDKEIKSS